LAVTDRCSKDVERGTHHNAPQGAPQALPDCQDILTRRTILLHSKNHPPAAPIVPTFTDRNTWKAAREFK
jgi:hypothetical protein